jgi:histidinol dehydrogenase
MTEIIYYPDFELRKKILARPYAEDTATEVAVKDIINDVRRGGDKSLLRYAKILDGVNLESLLVSKREIYDSELRVEPEVKEAINKAARNISKFHKAQISPDTDIETTSGVRCVLRKTAIDRVGLYIPGGTAPLFSTVLMLAIPAKIAGCKEITIFTPPSKDGCVNQMILYSAKVAGVDKIVKAGGAQAIAAMAYGTESIVPCNKIFGPGNRYVSIAKQLVSKSVSIDMYAGPSELMVIADDTANSSFVAADLLSQAEHGEDSQVFLVTTSEDFAISCRKEVYKQLENLSRRKELEGALAKSRIVVVKTLQEAVDIANEYAPEHLVVAATDPWDIAYKVCSAGSVFIGNYSPESAGDYASGTNHTLPTGGWARSQGGVNIDSFCRTYSIQELTREGLQGLASTIQTMADAEGLEAHSNAVIKRVEEQFYGN